MELGPEGYYRYGDASMPFWPTTENIKKLKDRIYQEVKGEWNTEFLKCTCPTQFFFYMWKGHRKSIAPTFREKGLIK